MALWIVLSSNVQVCEDIFEVKWVFKKVTTRYDIKMQYWPKYQKDMWKYLDTYK